MMILSHEETFDVIVVGGGHVGKFPGNRGRSRFSVQSILMNRNASSLSMPRLCGIRMGR